MNRIINLLSAEIGKVQQEKKETKPKQTGFGEIFQRQQKYIPILQNNLTHHPQAKSEKQLDRTIKLNYFIDSKREQRVVKNNPTQNSQDIDVEKPQESRKKEGSSSEEYHLPPQGIMDLLDSTLVEYSQVVLRGEFSPQDIEDLGQLLHHIEEYLLIEDGGNLNFKSLLREKLISMTNGLEDQDTERELQTFLVELMGLVKQEDGLDEKLKITEANFDFTKVGKEINISDGSVKSANKYEKNVEENGTEELRIHTHERNHEIDPIFSTNSNPQLELTDNTRNIENNIFVNQYLETQKLLQSSGLLNSEDVKEILGKNIVSQIVTSIEFSLKNARSEVNLQLMPENLGKLAIKLELERGILSGKVYAESIEVKQIIEANLNQLRSALEEKGMLIGSLDVFVGQDAEKSFQHHMGEKPKGKVALNPLTEEFKAVYEEESMGGTLYQWNSTFEGIV